MAAERIAELERRLQDTAARHLMARCILWGMQVGIMGLAFYKVITGAPLEPHSVWLGVAIAWCVLGSVQWILIGKEKP